MKEILERIFSNVNRFWRRLQLAAGAIIIMLAVARKEPELFPAWFVAQFPNMQMCCWVAAAVAQLTKKDPEEEKVSTSNEN